VEDRLDREPLLGPLAGERRRGLELLLARRADVVEGGELAAHRALDRLPQGPQRQAPEVRDRLADARDDLVRQRLALGLERGDEGTDSRFDGGLGHPRRPYSRPPGPCGGKTSRAQTAAVAGRPWP
jgi:hypothetical protein